MTGIYLLLGAILLGVLALLFLVLRTQSRAWFAFYRQGYAEPKRRLAEVSDDGSPTARLVNTILRTVIAAKVPEVTLRAEGEQVRMILPADELPLTVALEGEPAFQVPGHLLPSLLDRLKYLADVSRDLRGAELLGMIRISHLAEPWDITTRFSPTADGSSEQVTLRLVRASG